MKKVQTHQVFKNELLCHDDRRGFQKVHVLGLAEDPIQNNSSECHEEEDCELPVHTTDTLPQRKRKSSAASSDAYTRTPRSRKKLKADKDK